MCARSFGPLRVTVVHALLREMQPQGHVPGGRALGLLKTSKKVPMPCKRACSLSIFAVRHRLPRYPVLFGYRPKGPAPIQAPAGVTPPPQVPKPMCLGLDATCRGALWPAVLR